jgi:CRP-like cAMP-binding protein
MRRRAGGLEGRYGTGSSPRSSAGSSGGASQQAQAGRGPVLDVAQLEVLRRYGSEHDMAAGDVLFADGDVTYDLIVVLAGEARIIERRGQRGETVVAAHGRSQFLGEIGLLTGQRAYLSAVASTAGRVLRVPVEQVRVIMAQEPGLSELILRTFLLRHSILTGLGSGLTLIGSRFDASTRRLLEVLARNRLASRWLELEGSPEAEAMLRELEVPVADLPIVVVPGRALLRNPGSRELLDALGMSGPGDTDLAGVCDLLVVGAGPAGLAAAVYGASDGMATVLAEDTALGGQAGTSSRIENYLGFPAGRPGRSWRRARPCRRRSSVSASSWRPKRCRCRRRPACTGSGSTMAMRSPRSRSSSPPGRATTGCRWAGWPSSRVSASTTRPPRWRPRPAAAARSPSWAAATPPARPRCS